MTELTRLHTLTRELASVRHLGDLAQVVTRTGVDLFGADAGCTYVLRADGRLEMLAERGCTPRFKDEWRFIPAGCLSLAADGMGDEVFLGSASEFKTDAPGAEDLVDHSRRQLIGYAPLRAGVRLLGVFGFSYNVMPRAKPSGELTRTFASVAGLALTRFYLGTPNGESSLSLVPDPP